MSEITAAWFNSLIDSYNSTLGLSLSHVTSGTPMLSNQAATVYNAVSAAAYAQDYFVNLPSLSEIQSGAIIRKSAWGLPVPIVGTVSQFTQTATWIVPANCHSVMINWCIGGGGAGGAGWQQGNGGAGAGGGQGGWVNYRLVTCNPGDKFVFTVGAAGIPGTASGNAATNNGGAGGLSSVVYYPVIAGGSFGAPQTICSCLGGQGGQGSLITNTGNLVGGLGGSPNGLQGQNGLTGSGDTSSVVGAGGAPSPIAGGYGGGGGKIGGGATRGGISTGKNGTGYGSGGGGGGSTDRTPAFIWGGGYGAPGYIEICFPSNGATGGSPAANNSFYNVNASISSNSTGGNPVGNGSNGV